MWVGCRLNTCLRLQKQTHANHGVTWAVNQSLPLLTFFPTHVSCRLAMHRAGPWQYFLTSSGTHFAEKHSGRDHGRPILWWLRKSFRYLSRSDLAVWAMWKHCEEYIIVPSSVYFGANVSMFHRWGIIPWTDIYFRKFSVKASQQNQIAYPGFYARNYWFWSPNRTGLC